MSANLTDLIEGIRTQRTTLSTGSARERWKADNLGRLLTQIDEATQLNQSRLALIHDNPEQERVAASLYHIDLMRIIVEHYSSPRQSADKAPKKSTEKKSSAFFKPLKQLSAPFKIAGAMAAAFIALSVVAASSSNSHEAAGHINPVTNLLMQAKNKLQELVTEGHCIAINNHWLRTLEPTLENPWLLQAYPVMNPDSLSTASVFTINDGVLQLVQPQSEGAVEYLPLGDIPAEHWPQTQPHQNHGADDSDSGEEFETFPLLTQLYILKSIYRKIWADIEQQLQPEQDPSQPCSSVSP